MQLFNYLRKFVLIGILLFAAQSLAGCGGNALELAVGAPAIKLTTTAGSGWQAPELVLRCESQGADWSLSISSRASQPTSAVLLEVQFPQDYSVADVRCFTPEAQLSLLVADRPGVLAFGVIMPDGETISPGAILHATLRRGAPALRAARKAPAGSFGAVPDLAGVEDGMGGWTLTWGYYNVGDLNQDSQVAISDLTPLGIHFGEQSPAFPAPFDMNSIGAVVDTNGNGQVGLTDLTPIGINYQARVDVYRAFIADGPDPETANATPVADIPFISSTVTAGNRRQFAFTLPSAVLVDGSYYFLRPVDTTTGELGAASNALQFNQTVHIKFYKPAAGDFVVDGNQSQNSCLVLMPGIVGVSEPGAPVIVYTALGGGGGLSPLTLGYFGESGWTSEDIGGGGNFTLGAARWLPGGGTGSGLIVAYDIAASALVERRYNELWEATGGQEIGTGSGSFTSLALDVDPASGELGVAHAYGGLGTGNVVYSSSTGGSWSSIPVYDGEGIAGLTFRFDPAGGDPWLLFTHGTTTATSGLLTLDYKLEAGRLSGGNWALAQVPHPDAPQLVDLTFREDGTPQLAMTAARDYTLSIPGLDPWTISMLYDVLAGEYNGAAWAFNKCYDSALGISLEGFPLPTILSLDLNFASDVSWARPDELIYTESSGNIKIDITSFIPQDGGLATSSQYMSRQGSGFYAESGYYDGATGRAYSWQLNSGGQPVCAYVRSGSISVQDVLNGNFALAGELAYWQP